MNFCIVFISPPTFFIFFAAAAPAPIQDPMSTRILENIILINWNHQSPSTSGSRDLVPLSRQGSHPTTRLLQRPLMALLGAQNLGLKALRHIIHYGQHSRMEATLQSPAP